MKQIISPKPGRPRADRRPTLNIAATVDHRGEDEQQLVFVFRGAEQSLVEKAFLYLVGNGNGIAQAAFIHEEHDVVRRNGKGYLRIAAELTAPDYRFCSLDSMKLLIEGVFRRLHPCAFKWMSINKFLNV